jgi:hypothetical protein
MFDKCEISAPCSSLAACNNTAGSFECLCMEGNEGNGIGEDGCQEFKSQFTNQLLHLLIALLTTQSVLQLLALLKRPRKM